ncbi:gp53-like domain-containing protein [Achromobacter spanius]|uniref:Putative tail fiber protein gp53-like C-terminal domain-containing protein n=1 Tax=Achromobacter spanius TaxID=217203 RepID=A0A2S0IB08_9BURK|nr:hypothetical protein [Achromobacter spanius]AVJ29148.1 hypothetical protein CLM73_19655 [Achromobacter spanius]
MGQFVSGRVVPATQTVAGVIEIATTAETGAATDDTRAVTPLKLGQFVSGRVVPATESVAGLIEIATTAETGAATDDTRAVTPLKLGQFVSGRVIPATEAAAGIARVATQAQTNAGTDDATIVTPKKLRFGFSMSLGNNGYLSFPSWLGGLILQWGRGTITLNNNTNPVYYTGSYAATLPIPFPNNIFGVFPTIGNTPNALDTISVAGMTTASVSFTGATSNEAAQAPNLYYLAIGN